MLRGVALCFRAFLRVFNLWFCPTQLLIGGVHPLIIGTFGLTKEAREPMLGFFNGPHYRLYNPHHGMVNALENPAEEVVNPTQHRLEQARYQAQSFF